MASGYEKYLETRTFMAPGDVIDISAKGSDWTASADLHFIGWIAKQPVFYLVHFNGDESFNHASSIGIKIRNQRNSLGPLGLKFESDPKNCRKGVAWISFLWRGAKSIEFTHTKRSRIWQYMENSDG